MPTPAPNPAPDSRPRSLSIVAAGLLLVALAVVVIYTNRGAFFSPLALVVVAAIGLAALLLQLRLRPGLASSSRGGRWMRSCASLATKCTSPSFSICKHHRLRSGPNFPSRLCAVICSGIPLPTHRWRRGMSAARCWFLSGCVTMGVKPTDMRLLNT